MGHINEILECTCGSKGLKDFDLIMKCPLVFHCNTCDTFEEISCNNIECLDCAHLLERCEVDE